MIRRTSYQGWRGRVVASSIVAALALAAALPAGAAAQSPGHPYGLSRLLAAGAGGITRGIATFRAVPTAAQASALRALGLRVQPMRHVPLAIVVGQARAMELAWSRGIVQDIYPDERLEYFDTASSNAMGAAVARSRGFTGKGVTVAVVDSGCDASHPDLARRVKHNVKIYGPEYANGRSDSSTTVVVPIEVGPYQNTDLGSGHGTHVAGIIAADSTTDPIKKTRLGVAPGADLVCYAVGEVLFTTMVVTAYDHLLDQKGLWGVDVINNSWGNSYRQFDPRDPVNVVTRAVADLGVVVVFAAGNSGYSEAEMSLNPFSQAPWVISVAAGTIASRQSVARAEFSSNGLHFDNSTPTSIGAGGHTVFLGDRIGVYHPDLTAPGEDVSSTCDSAGLPVLIAFCPPPNYSNTRLSGTSMAAPHVAGAAAVLKQANPRLSVAQVRRALEVTATPVKRHGSTANAPFWQVGYGYANLSAAVDLVRRPDWQSRLALLSAAADRRVLASDAYAVSRSDFWTYDAPRVAAAGTHTRTVTTFVPRGVTHLKVTLSHPSLAVAQLNGMAWSVTVKDARGKVVGRTTETDLLGAGTSFLFTPTAGFTAGTWTFTATAEYAVSDPDTLDSESLLGRMVTLQVAQLVRNR